MSETIVAFDPVRMFVGSQSWMFYLEIVVRTFIVYVYALILIRWVGGRGIAQMSIVEFLLVIALGSAVGDAMFYPEVPLLHAMLVITVIVLINKVLDILIFRFRSVEKLLDGETAQVVSDGVINMKTLRDANIGKSELFESLRRQGYCNLGAVRQAYLETSGHFSFFASDPPQAGLQIEPAWSLNPPKIFKAGQEIGPDMVLACCICGTTARALTKIPAVCDCCGGAAWTPAYKPKE